MKKIGLFLLCLPCALSFMLARPAYAGLHALYPHGYDLSASQYGGSSVCTFYPTPIGGNGGYLYNDGTDWCETYLRFDLSGISEQERILSAVLVQMAGGSSDWFDQPSAVDVYHVPENSWSPSAITWNTKPDLGVLLAEAMYVDSGHKLTFWDLSLIVNSTYSARDSLSLAMIMQSAPEPFIPATTYLLVTTSTAPVASDQTTSALEGTAKSITLIATDADGGPLTYSVVTEPLNGTLGGSAPNLVYFSAAGFRGSDSFTFRANDGLLDSNTATVSILIAPETTRPNGTIVINNGAATTTSWAVTLNLLASDIGGSGLASMRFRNGDAEPYCAWLPYQTSSAWWLAGGAGTKKVYAQFMDEAGNISDANPAAAGAQGYMDGIALNPFPVGILLINNPASIFPPSKLNADGTKKKSPVYFNHLMHEASYSCVSCHHTDSGLAAGGIPTKLCFDCHGPVAVGNQLDSYQIIHGTSSSSCLACHKAVVYTDPTATAPTACSRCHSGVEPVQESVPPSGSIKINNGASSTTSTAVTLSLLASDTGGSALASMRFRNSDLEPYSAWEPYQTTKSWTLAAGGGTRKVYVQFVDGAGNISDANPAAAGAQGYLDSIVLNP